MGTPATIRAGFMPHTHALSASEPRYRAELRELVKLALPLAGANLIQMAVYAVDVIFVARLGPENLAASSLSVSLFGLLMGSMTGLVGAGSLRVGFAVPMILVLGIIPLAPAFAPRVAAAVSARRPSAS